MKTSFSFLFLLAVAMIASAASVRSVTHGGDLTSKASKMLAVMDKLEPAEKMSMARHIVRSTRTAAKAKVADGKGAALKPTNRSNYCAEFYWCTNFGNCDWNWVCTEPCRVCGF